MEEIAVFKSSRKQKQQAEQNSAGLESERCCTRLLLSPTCMRRRRRVNTASLRRPKQVKQTTGAFSRPAGVGVRGRRAWRRESTSGEEQAARD
ncbi:hypothetical protein PAMP_014552 [Pampus punctatissimus]